MPCDSISDLPEDQVDQYSKRGKKAEGYVTRRCHPEDGRRVLVAPTKRSLRAPMTSCSGSSKASSAVVIAPASDSEVVASFLDDAIKGLSEAAPSGPVE